MLTCAYMLDNAFFDCNFLFGFPIGALKDTEASYSDKEEAERLKNEGNDLMKREKYEDALKNYTKAIQLDCKNPVYFCNR